jgi:hypothetical protein
MRGTIASRMLWRLLALFALAGTIELAAPEKAAAGGDGEYTDGYDGDESDGPGTRYRQCRAEAWADYNECLMDDPGDTSNEVTCFFLWDLDNVGCDTQLILDLAGLFSIFK